MTSSVALCTYNGENHIAEQLESILSQEKPVYEIIICDDGSTDGTLKIISNYAAQFPDIIKIYENPKNLGYIANFEKAMNLCCGDIVFLCDQDDRWYKNKTVFITDLFEKNTDINIVSHNIKLFGEAINSASETTYWDVESVDYKEFKHPEDIVKRILYQGNIFPGMSMAIRNTFLKKHLPLKKISPVIIHDYELLLLASDKDTVWVEKNILGEYRIHPQQNIGYKTFSQFSTSGKEAISRESLFTTFKRFPFVKKTIAGLQLNPELENGYRNYCMQRYEDYLKSLPVFERWMASVKMKYYFHIFDYLK